MAKGLDIDTMNIPPKQQDGSNTIDNLWIKNCTVTDTMTQEHANEFIKDEVLR